MRRQFNNFVSVGYSIVRMTLYKMFNWRSFHAGIIQRFSPNVILEFNKGSNVQLGRKIRIHSGSKIKVRSNAELVMGNDVKINYNCIIACHKKISIGDGTEFGPSVYIYDHDHCFDKNMGVSSNTYNKSDVEMGKNVWIGANTIILRGSKIGDNCVVGAGCVIKGQYPNGSIIIQRRNYNKVDFVKLI